MTERKPLRSTELAARPAPMAAPAAAGRAAFDRPADIARLEADAERVATAVAPARAAPQPAGIDAVRSGVERRLGHEFGRLDVHADAAAAASARRLDAVAYALGSDVYLDPAALDGDRPRRDHVLAHELAHVAQQAAGRAPRVPQLQHRPRPAPVDAKAQAIIDEAQASDKPIERRGPAVVKAIIDQYWSADASKIVEITYRDGEHGLHVTYSGRGAQAVGHVTVGRYFVEHTTQYDFARRVLQVRHEIEHVEQERGGMTGAGHSDEREFGAFYHEATTAPPAGTGRMQHATHVSVIDAALAYYCCLSEELQKANKTRHDELLKLRVDEIKASARDDLGDPPSTCRRQAD